MNSGIYKILNIKSDKFYIGSSQNLKSRRSTHFALLKNGKHQNTHLQNAYNLYGRDSFEFTIIEECDLDKLVEREQYHIDTYWESGLMYNVARIAGASFRHKTHSEATKQKMREWQTKNGNAMKGKNQSEETKKLLSKIHTEKFKFRRLFSKEQVDEMFKMHNNGIGCRPIAKKFGVSRTTIIRILKGERYKEFVS